MVFKPGSMVSGYIEGRVDNVHSKDKGANTKDQIQVVPVTFGIVFQRSDSGPERARPTLSCW